MLFQKTELLGAFLIKLEARGDARGMFARTFCVNEFAAHGLETRFVNQNMSVSAEQGTLRGMHCQIEPAAEVKVIRCVRGAIFDVIVDIRPDSPTYLKWQGFELTDQNKDQLYIPKGFLHGFQTLQDDTEVSYLVSEFYAPEAERGARHDDPAFGIEWPVPVTVLSDKDASWADYKASAFKA
ncbi:MAG: dTDP-4-dehydrorhamnose 3,5-epimerase [Alphaproteobacteria bacterium]|nr:dTDP-4-dehydrorhamnose 3,5-epimerase [Alphaproteobacteria bacterium]